MDMQETVKNIIIINVYWFTLPLMGFAILKYLSVQSRKILGLQIFAKYVLKQHAFTIFLYSFATFFAVNVIISLALYLTHAPAKYFTIIYIILLIISGAYLSLLFLRNMFKTSNIDLFKLNKLNLFTKTIFILLVFIIVCDFFLGLYVKSFFAGDAVFHMSRIVDIITTGYNVSSPHHSNLPEAAYHYNAIYSLYVPAVQIFNIPAFNVWEYSLSFFRLLQWTAIFTLALYVAKQFLSVKKRAILFASAFSILGIALSAGYLFIADYPNRLVDVWLILLVISISLHEKNISGFKITIPIISLILTFTHPTYSLMVLGFMVLFLIVKTILTKTIVFRNNIVYFISLLILSISPLISYFVPGQLNQAQLEILKPRTINVLGNIVKMPFIYENIPKGLGVSLALLSFIGFVFLIYKLIKQKRQLALVVSLIVFFPLIVYVPFMYSQIAKVFPYWLIERFSQMNILATISTGIGLYAIAYIIQKKIKITKYTNAIFVITCVILLCLSAFIARYSYNYLMIRGGWNQYGYENIRTNYMQAKNIYPTGGLVVTSLERSFFLPGIFAVDVLAVEDGHSTKAADTTNRLLCHKEVMRSLRYQDLAFLNVKYIELPNEGVNISTMDLKYLKQIGSVQGYSVFEFAKTPGYIIAPSDVTKACYDFEKNENSTKRNTNI